MSGPPVVPGDPASSNSTTALVLGIIGVTGSVGSCCCCLFVVPGACAPVAWYMGRQELAAIRAGRSPAAGEGSAQAGMILGMVGSALLLLYVLGMIAYVALVGGAAALEAMKHGVPH